MAQQGDWSLYEWDVEEVMFEYEDGEEANEVIDHSFWERASECLVFMKQEPLKPRHRWDMALVLDDQDERSWAYVDMKTMTLPERFENAIGQKGRKVPKRFHEELAKAIK